MRRIAAGSVAALFLMGGLNMPVARAEDCSPPPPETGTHPVASTPAGDVEHIPGTGDGVILRSNRQVGPVEIGEPYVFVDGSGQVYGRTEVWVRPGVGGGNADVHSAQFSAGRNPCTQT